VGLAVGKLPGLRIDRSGIALVGGTAMVVTGLLPAADALRAIDFGTIALLFGMMVVVAYLRLAGFFERLTRWTLARVTSPRGVLAVTIGLSGVLSAFLVNDVVCVAMAPFVLELARRTRRNPVPFLLGLATAANIGSVATITGNPQNMIIGSLSGIPYLRFAYRLAPVALLGMVLDFALIAFFYRRALGPTPESARAHGPASKPLSSPPATRAIHRAMLIKGLVVTGGAVALFFAGFPIALVALGAAALLLLGRVRSDRLFRQIDWNLLVLFAGLFVVVHGFTQIVVGREGAPSWILGPLEEAPLAVLGIGSAVLANVVSNVPGVLLVSPFVSAMNPQVRELGWLTLAMSSTLAGNLTVVGSVANLIVIEGARREGISVSFWEYCRVGIPLTLVTLCLGGLWLAATR
jgi:Na+/H+ antiporter NhaD/arsenite permease-like protein